MRCFAIVREGLEEILRDLPKHIASSAFTFIIISDSKEGSKLMTKPQRR